MNDNQILEALKIQPLSEEEKTARHILGRLWGPIATCKESTRNGRLYNKPLWEKALVDELFLEKVSTKSLFLELGHPTDREETDMTKACACIPEVPKIVNGDLYAYVDILDTPNGRLLKTLVDYGFVPGISSRGSGDIMANDEVDPETFFLETWDIVQLPAVRKARLSICESIDKDALKLKKALTESLNAANDEDKKQMQEALEKLNISLTEDLLVPAGVNGAMIKPEDIPVWDETEDILLEDGEDVTEEPEDSEEISVEESDLPEEDSDEEVEIIEDEVSEITTVGEIQDKLAEVEPETKIEVENIEIEGQEFEVSSLNVKVDEESETVKVGVNCESVEVDSEDKVELPEEEADSEEESTEVESEDETEEAVDNGDDEIIESLKEVIRQKDALEKEVKSLRNEKTVGDAKEKELQEELAKYKAAFARTSELAAKATKFESEVKKLTEQLTQKDIQIQDLNCKAEKAKKLNESIDENAKKVRILTEKLGAMQKESEELESNLNGQIAQCNKTIKERTTVAKKYKTKFVEAVNKYVESKASMLGVRPIDITSKLGESYTLADIDRVCDDLLESTVSISRLPFGGMNKARAKISESVTVNKKVNKPTNPDYGYEIDDSLLELAGLKK